MVHVALAVDVVKSALGTTAPGSVEQIWLPVELVTTKKTVPWSTWPTAG